MTAGVRTNLSVTPSFYRKPRLPDAHGSIPRPEARVFTGTILKLGEDPEVDSSLLPPVRVTPAEKTIPAAVLSPRAS